MQEPEEDMFKKFKVQKSKLQISMFWSQVMPIIDWSFFLRISRTTSPINPKLYQVTPLQWRNPEKIALHSDVVFIFFTV